MANGEKFCLRWNEFENNISSSFQELRNDKDFFDVTLACDDNQLQAHKVILSACSPFFRSVLKKNPHQHPLLYCSLSSQFHVPWRGQYCSRRTQLIPGCGRRSSSQRFDPDWTKAAA